ncbi:hypothetical protein I551_8584 [Mycobacterium ulcerans str. Harvey]|uniref:Uncharacterized protein n=1 Tax=Mycobacterium ulcerans str. Harvey TaxID=1299332 RepID=A0ABP3AUI6_MYCUL|nr:hypothetical protein I551_8584 [Mycobacterium ulcerans str. Harvey]
MWGWGWGLLEDEVALVPLMPNEDTAACGVVGVGPLDGLG